MQLLLLEGELASSAMSSVLLWQAESDGDTLHLELVKYHLGALLGRCCDFIPTDDWPHCFAAAEAACSCNIRTASCSLAVVKRRLLMLSPS